MRVVLRSCLDELLLAAVMQLGELGASRPAGTTGL